MQQDNLVKGQEKCKSVKPGEEAANRNNPQNSKKQQTCSHLMQNNTKHNQISKAEKEHLHPRSNFIVYTFNALENIVRN